MLPDLLYQRKFDIAAQAFCDAVQAGFNVGDGVGVNARRQQKRQRQVGVKAEFAAGQKKKTW